MSPHDVHKMVEDLPPLASAGVTSKLLFINNMQATLIASDPNSISKMLFEGFEMPRPRLVINLLMSMNCDMPPAYATGNKIDNPWLPHAKRAIDAMQKVRAESCVYRNPS